MAGRWPAAARQTTLTRRAASGVIGRATDARREGGAGQPRDEGDAEPLRHEGQLGLELVDEDRGAGAGQHPLQPLVADGAGLRGDPAFAAQVVEADRAGLGGEGVVDGQDQVADVEAELEAGQPGGERGRHVQPFVETATSTVPRRMPSKPACRSVSMQGRLQPRVVDGEAAQGVRQQPAARRRERGDAQPPGHRLVVRGEGGLGLLDDGEHPARRARRGPGRPRSAAAGGRPSPRACSWSRVRASPRCWEIADGVQCRASAAAVTVPNMATARSAWSRGRSSMKRCYNDVVEPFDGASRLCGPTIGR